MLQDTEFPDVFLSHAHEDSGWVRTLASALRQEGFVVFFDEDSLRYGDDVPLLIDRALTTAIRIVLVMSTHSLKSKWVQFESTHDWLDGSARLLPLRLSVEPLPPRLQRLKYIDFRDCSFQEGFTNLLKALRAVDILTLGPLGVNNISRLTELCQEVIRRVALYFTYNADTLSDFELCCLELGRNALLHTQPAHAYLTIRAARDALVIKVLDNGPGFDLEETLSRGAAKLRSDPRTKTGRGLQLVAAHSDFLEATAETGGHLVTAVVGFPHQFRLLRSPLTVALSSARESRFTVCAPVGQGWAYVMVNRKLSIGSEPGIYDILFKLILFLEPLRRVAVDLTACPLLDSSWITDLVASIEMCMDRRIGLLLVGGPRVADQLVITQMISLVRLVSSTKEAEMWLVSGNVSEEDVRVE